jgi:arylsulfatase A-like enzyme
MTQCKPSSVISVSEALRMKPYSLCTRHFCLVLISSQGDHSVGFLGDWPTPVNNPHSDLYKIPFMIYNPRIKNPTKRSVTGNFYSLSIPTTVMDLMTHTGSFEQEAQVELASQFASNYEHAQSLLRPVNETLRFFLLSPGGTHWIVDNGRNLRVTSFPR